MFSNNIGMCILELHQCVYSRVIRITWVYIFSNYCIKCVYSGIIWVTQLLAIWHGASICVKYVCVTQFVVMSHVCMHESFRIWTSVCVTYVCVTHMDASYHMAGWALLHISNSCVWATYIKWVMSKGRARMREGEEETHTHTHTHTQTSMSLVTIQSNNERERERHIHTHTHT